MRPVVEMRSIVKVFPPNVVAVDNTDFTLYEGEILGLLGENGAGKTTLMRILYGLYKPDKGEIFVYGKRVNIKSPKDAMALGIGMIHQHFELIPAHTVAENVALGSKKIVLNLKEVSEKIREISQRYSLQVDPDAKVETLSVGERQRVEIIKALYRGARILILDEPTSVLAPHEVDGLFTFMREMKKSGNSIIFITHKLYEALSICDRITVMRRGKIVASLSSTEAEPSKIAELMVGAKLEATYISRVGELYGGGRVRIGDSESKDEHDGSVLEVINLTVRDIKGAIALNDFSINVRKGEILGLAGVAGNGQKELVEALAGLRYPVGGRIVLAGKDITTAGVRERFEMGLGVIFEDRLQVGIIGTLSVKDNLVIDKLHRPPFSKFSLINSRAVRDFAGKLIKEFFISVPSLDAPAITLSGGNIQKLILARVLSSYGNLKVLVVSEPTAGLDIAATYYIRSKLLELKQRGIGILLISTNLDEILSLSDRVAVIYRGRVQGLVRAGEADRKYLGMLMCGLSPDNVRAG